MLFVNFVLLYLFICLLVLFICLLIYLCCTRSGCPEKGRETEARKMGLRWKNCVKRDLGESGRENKSKCYGNERLLIKRIAQVR